MTKFTIKGASEVEKSTFSISERVQRASSLIRTHRSGFAKGALLVAFALALVAVAVGTQGVFADHGGPYGDTEMKKVVLCHWNNHSYESSGDVAVASALNGHVGAGHQGGLDIIPPFHHKDGSIF